MGDRALATQRKRPKEVGLGLRVKGRNVEVPVAFVSGERMSKSNVEVSVAKPKPTESPTKVQDSRRRGMSDQAIGQVEQFNI